LSTPLDRRDATVLTADTADSAKVALAFAWHSSTFGWLTTMAGGSCEPSAQVPVYAVSGTHHWAVRTMMSRSLISRLSPATTWSWIFSSRRLRHCHADWADVDPVDRGLWQGHRRGTRPSGARASPLRRLTDQRGERFARLTRWNPRPDWAALAHHAELSPVPSSF